MESYLVMFAFPNDVSKIYLELYYFRVFFFFFRLHNFFFAYCMDMEMLQLAGFCILLFVKLSTVIFGLLLDRNINFLIRKHVCITKNLLF